MEQKRVLVIKGINQYGVLSYMLEGMAAELETRGYQVQVCLWNEIEQWKQWEWDICVSSQAIDMTFEIKAKQYVTWLVDHPVLLTKRLVENKEKNNFWIGCVDQTHVAYLKNVAGFSHVFYLPHFSGIADKVRKYKDREIEVFFPASYLNLEEFEEEHSEWRNGAVKVVSDQVISFLQSNNEVSVEEAVKIILEQMGETVEKEFLIECMEGFGSYIDEYICRYYRNRVVRALLDAGVNLTVVGTGWSNYEKCDHQRGNLNILSEDMSYEEVLVYMANSKMVLNVLPWFKNGSHERIASALQNGALCLTDQNQYTNKLLADGESAVLYDRNNPSELAEKIHYYLEHSDEAEMIAQKGRNVATQNMTVKNSVDMLLKGIKELPV